MHEEVSDKTVNLAVRTGKVTVRTLVQALKAYIRHRRNKSAKKEVKKNTPVKGKQSVKELIPAQKFLPIQNIQKYPPPTSYNLPETQTLLPADESQ